jgi:hypothetical protein
MSKPSADSESPGEEPRRAPPIGRALRIVLGLWLLVYVVPPYLEHGLPFAVRALLLVLGLAGVYNLLQTLLSRWTINPLLATVIALSVLAALYLAGAPGSLIFGHGEGQLAAGTFLGLSLVVAGVCAVPGCELTAIPGLIFRKHTELWCPIFSPVDTLERMLRSKRR